MVGASKPADVADDAVGTCIALAFPDRVARRRDASGEIWASVGGRGYRLDAASPLARGEWLAVAEVAGSAAGARILSAAPIESATVETLLADRVGTRRSVPYDPATGSVEAIRERRIGAISLARSFDASVDPQAMTDALVEGVRAHGLGPMLWGEAAALRTRARYAGESALEDAELLARLDEWLPPLLAGRRRLAEIPTMALRQALVTLLGWPAMARIDERAPAALVSPAGLSHAIDYAAEGGPRVELRVQALFGLATHPTLGDGTPLTLSLTSPAGRPIQTTRDLPGFWAGSWAAIAKEMRGRYPRHPWPDDPATATATMRTKNADARARGSR